MQNDPPITLFLNRCSEADQPLHMEWVAGNNIEKLATNKRKSRKLRLGAKKKSNISYLELFQLQEASYWPRVLCQQCLASVATTRGNTPNLFDHLRRYHTAESCTGLSLKTRPYMPYLKLHPTRFPTVAQITFCTRADPLWIVTYAWPAPEGKLDRRNFL